MVSENDALRLRRLVFYAADIDRINAVLLAFVKKANVFFLMQSTSLMVIAVTVPMH